MATGDIQLLSDLRAGTTLTPGHDAAELLIASFGSIHADTLSASGEASVYAKDTISSDLTAWKLDRFHVGSAATGTFTIGGRKGVRTHFDVVVVL